MTAFSTPGLVIGRLEEIEADLAIRQNALEDAAMRMARAKRDYEREFAIAFLSAQGPQEERKQRARIASELDREYAEATGLWEGLKAVVRVLETRASMAQSVLRSQSKF